MDFIIVHCGAGRYSENNVGHYKALCKRAISHGQQMLKCETNSARYVTVQICKMLEDDVLTNAGTGSNLNYDGRVELDASIIDSSTMLGTSVGAVGCVRNPIELAEQLAQDIVHKSTQEPRSLPLFLCGNGAQRYAEKLGLTVEESALITKRSKSSWRKWITVTSNNRDGSGKHLHVTTGHDDSAGKEVEREEHDDSDYISDTVGVICGDSRGMICAASSSGGTLLKSPGRIGPAAVIGAGTQVQILQSGSIIATVATGHGEDILTTRLASSVGEDDQDGVFARLSKHYPHLQSCPLYAGFISVVRRSDKHTEMSYSHTTESMIFGYASGQSKPRVVHSQNKKNLVASGGSLL